jgi:anthranilate/para-aminobenzoate synthase component II
MKILLINNGDKPQVNLENFLRNYGSVEIIPYDLISENTSLFEQQNFDLIVLSGSGYVPLIGNTNLYKLEIDLVMTTKIPVIGICFGFEVIAYAYGEELKMKEQKIEGLNEIYLTGQEENKYMVWQNHFWYLDKVENVLPFATSVNGIEIIKASDNKNIYGIQFHPEHIEPANSGKKLFDLVLSYLNLI